MIGEQKIGKRSGRRAPIFEDPEGPKTVFPPVRVMMMMMSTVRVMASDFSSSRDKGGVKLCLPTYEAQSLDKLA